MRPTVFDIQSARKVSAPKNAGMLKRCAKRGMRPPGAPWKVPVPRSWPTEYMIKFKHLPNWYRVMENIRGGYFVKRKQPHSQYIPFTEEDFNIIGWIACEY